MKIRRELWFGFILMGLIIAGTAVMLLSAPKITNGHLGLKSFNDIGVDCMQHIQFAIFAHRCINIIAVTNVRHCHFPS